MAGFQNRAGAPHRFGWFNIENSPASWPGRVPLRVIRSVDRADIDQTVRRQPPATAVTVAVMMAMAMAMAVGVMAVPMSVAMTVSVSAVAVAMATSHSRAVDGERGRAQRENSKRRHDELPGPCHGLLPVCAARGSPCCDRKLDPLDVVRCDRDHASRRSAAASRIRCCCQQHDRRDGCTCVSRRAYAG